MHKDSELRARGRGAGRTRTILPGVGLVLMASILAAGFSGLVAARSQTPGQTVIRPPEVRSMRHEVRDLRWYEDVSAQWERFVGEHPSDARAWVEWGDAVRYRGDHVDARLKYERAFEIDSSDVAAVEAYASPDIHAGKPGTWRLAYLRLQRAFASDPTYPNTPYTLVLGAMRDGDPALTRRCLQAMVDQDMSRPLIQYGRNMVAGAPEGAIIFTNGDNDTYPCWVYQELAGGRPDVEIVNLSLLNTTWYIRYLRERGLPVQLSDKEIAQLRHTHDRKISDQMQAHIFESLRLRGWPRPLFYAVTVYPAGRVLPCKTVLEGLLERIVPAEGPQTGIREQNWGRMRDLIDRVYDFGGATDVFVDWERESAVARLMLNYAALLQPLGDWLLDSELAGEADPYLFDAVRILTFHGEGEWAAEILKGWEAGSRGRESKLLQRARQLVGP